jgi:hypothetical protein
MKVFISHSSRDKWVARKISEDINRIGIGTFLDEKDIETGTSIDDAVDEHLKDCDELLILLSPTSLNSHWVLMEIGGAKALGKRLVPILFHVGANEIPAPIRKHLARELNEIEKYYVELQARMAGNVVVEQIQPSREELAPKSRETVELKIGDRVQIMSRPQHDVRQDVAWVSPEMDEYCGKSAKVVRIYSDRSVGLDVDDDAWAWAFEWLIKQ